MPVLRLIFHVRNINRDPARFFFRGVIDLIVRAEIRSTQHRAIFRDRGGQGRFAMVDIILKLSKYNKLIDRRQIGRASCRERV